MKPGDTITIERLDLLSGVLSGEFQIDCIYRDSSDGHRLANLTRDGRRVCTGYCIEPKEVQTVQNYERGAATASLAGRFGSLHKLPPKPKTAVATSSRKPKPAAAPTFSDAPINVPGIVGIIDLANLLTRNFYGSPESKINGVRGTFAKVAQLFDRFPFSVIVFADEGGNAYRRAIDPTYKANRKDKPKPIGLTEQTELARQAIDAIGWPRIQVEGYEADDVIASVAKSLVDRSDQTIAVTTDKDLLQLVGNRTATIVNPYPKSGESGMVRRKEIVEKFNVEPNQLRDLLAMAGDSSDNVSGLPGVGQKTAAALLEKYKTLDAILEAAPVMAAEPKAKAIWSNIAVSVDNAIKCRQLVSLVDDLPLPRGWEDRKSHLANEGWSDALASAGLTKAAHQFSKIIEGTYANA